MAMCASCDAVDVRRLAASTLLMVCEQQFGIGEAIRSAYPVDPDIPDHLRRFLDRL
jgi:hypothetical protein